MFVHTSTRSIEYDAGLNPSIPQLRPFTSPLTSNEIGLSGKNSAEWMNMGAESPNGRNKGVIANAANSSGHLIHKMSTGIAALGTCPYPGQEDHLDT